MTLYVDPAICPQNHKCPLIEICPVGAISQIDFNLPKIDKNVCIECTECMETCPMKAVRSNDS